MDQNSTIQDAIITPIYNMVMAALESGEAKQKINVGRQVAGVRALSEQLSVSVSFIYQMKKQGVLDAAIVSQIGKRIVFNVDKAWELAKEFQEKQRMDRKERRRNNE